MEGFYFMIIFHPFSVGLTIRDIAASWLIDQLLLT